MYFTRFHPIFPIVHAPTFRPSAKRSLLLISICSVGSLFLGSPYAVAQGNRLFERLNKAILASVCHCSCISVVTYANGNPLQWEMYFVRGAPEALAMTQAALLGQTFAMLSGVRMRSLQKIVRRLIDYMTESETHRLVSNISWDTHSSKSRTVIECRKQLLIRTVGSETEYV